MALDNFRFTHLLTHLTRPGHSNHPQTLDYTFSRSGEIGIRSRLGIRRSRRRGT